MPLNHMDMESVIVDVCEAFGETVRLKIQQLRRYIEKGANPALTGQYVEYVVRSFLRDWIGHRQLVTGTFYSKSFKESGLNPLQIDGIVYDPTLGPVIMRQDDFVVVNPMFCTGVIEIKTSFDRPLHEFSSRLKLIHDMYCGHMPAPTVMGLIISDPNPEAKSTIVKGDWSFGSYHYRMASWHPIFILFREEDGEYEPYMPAIDAMIRAMYSSIYEPVRLVN